MRKLLALAAAAWLAGTVSIAAAQDYLFSVPKLEMQVTIQPDASVLIVYDITFQNNPAAHAIDIVDIGVPHSDYDLGNVRASVGGLPLSDIRHSEFVKPGFEAHLGGRAIPPGGSGTVHVEFTMPDMVYQDTTRGDYASLQITPTWFGEQYVTGSTDLHLAVHLPQGVNPAEVLHQGQAFDQKARFADGTSVTWRWPATRLTGPHEVGVSFPKRAVSRVIQQTAIGLLLKWFAGSTQARVMLGIVFLVLFGIAFFRFSGGTGVSVFVVLSAVAVWMFVVSPVLHLLAVPGAAVLIWLTERSLRRRKLRYMPPIAEVEGGGIKRGLSAAEAAVLLEMPLGSILGLVIFGMLKKGIVRQVDEDPLTVEVAEAFRLPASKMANSEKGRDHFYSQAGQKAGTVVHHYEQPFIFLIGSNAGKPVHRINFASAMRQLIELTAARMKGFDLSDTQDYYRAIVRRAAQEAKGVGEIEQRQERIDRDFEWILMDGDWPTVFQGPYRPVWTRGGSWGTHFPSGAPGLPSGTPSAPGGGGKPSFGDVASSFTGWTENTMGRFAATIAPGSLAAEGRTGGFLDLSGADRITGEFFKALAENSGRGGGGGGGCACAGCACACACAGGGR